MSGKKKVKFYGKKEASRLSREKRHPAKPKVPKGNKKK